eukprot:TRINITY_DN1533_c0_g1_i1.p1 TRINITY_DN1533_c0_g1~~TRINITY_DN1533_c0_g1_i1.p1  ORF type:complete len:366 (+),score=87.53 TRINITY_DN1533_c0_g1_i1:131-1228(+)
MLRSLVGSEMCIRDRYQRRVRGLSRALMLPSSPPSSPARCHRASACSVCQSTKRQQLCPSCVLQAITMKQLSIDKANQTSAEIQPQLTTRLQLLHKHAQHRHAKVQKHKRIRTLRQRIQLANQKLTTAREQISGSMEASKQRRVRLEEDVRKLAELKASHAPDQNSLLIRTLAWHLSLVQEQHSEAQRQVLGSLGRLIPISHDSILGLDPNSADSEESAAALGYVLLFVERARSILGIELSMDMRYGGSRSGICWPGGRLYYPLFETEHAHTDMGQDQKVGRELLLSNTLNLCAAMGQLTDETNDRLGMEPATSTSLLSALSRLVQSPTTARRFELASLNLSKYQSVAGKDQSSPTTTEEGWNLV